MTAFDPIKAQVDILSAMTDAHKAISVRLRDAERRATEAEAELNGLRLIDAWTKDLIEQQQERIKVLRAEAERSAKAFNLEPTT